MVAAVSIFLWQASIFLNEGWECAIPAGIKGWRRRATFILFPVFLKKDLTVSPFLSSYPTRELNHHSLSFV